ncbi:Periplasmic hemin-binding protein [Methylophaga frappieri]|uniref:Periplasmic hemin-binding protein n=1 Tax=Methylophaga frappieri (strain ATCC BAA-2434 / DSM 25690 / JAM7) TaxID=754477 RepID=I1YJ00_METFJ|nr:ABC transporter substrate-binding protein [Methylophaga frappieri]AFJ02893.1 Periplasmic hemin-binding protein [Methylophaga frappieri]
MLKKLILLITLFIPLYSHADVTSLAPRIVSVDSNATEILLALELGDHIVATDITSQSLLPSAVDNLGYHRTLSAEGLLQTNADWVIGSDHMGPPETLRLLEKAPLKLVQLASPTSLDALSGNVMQLGTMLAREDLAKALVTDIAQRQKKLADTNSSHQLRMVFLLDLGDRGLSQAGTGTTAAALITLLNGNNISTFSGYQSVSIEALLSANPDVILIGQRADGELDPANLLERYPLLENTRAGTQQQIIGINAAKLIAGLSLGALDEALRVSALLSASRSP